MAALTLFGATPKLKVKKGDWNGCEMHSFTLEGRDGQLQDGCTDIEEGVLLWLEAGDHSYCLFVDELLGQQQVVVKQLPSFVNSYNIKNYGINGCTLRSDGSISIILDVANLYAASRGM